MLLILVNGNRSRRPVGHISEIKLYNKIIYEDIKPTVHWLQVLVTCIRRVNLGARALESVFMTAMTDIFPSTHTMLNQCWFNVGPASYVDFCLLCCSVIVINVLF